MIVKTSVLDRVAFYTTFHAEILDIEGTYPDNIFTINVPRWLNWYFKAGGWVPHNRFCNQRRHLKRKTRRLSGLPEHFTGNVDTIFKMGDIALVRPWRKDPKIVKNKGM